MLRMIEIQNPINGETVSRSSDTFTIDVPPEFDRSKGIVSLDSKQHAHHLAADGNNHAYTAMTRPLSWRAYGEECLVADRPGRPPSPSAGVYRLRAVKRP